MTRAAKKKWTKVWWAVVHFSGLPLYVVSSEKDGTTRMSMAVFKNKQSAKRFAEKSAIVGLQVKRVRVTEE